MHAHGVRRDQERGKTGKEDGHIRACQFLRLTQRLVVVRAEGEHVAVPGISAVDSAAKAASAVDLKAGALAGGWGGRKSGSGGR